jgi:hypothetical protein
VTPHLFAPWFGGAHFGRLARVLEFTSALHCPTWQRTIERITPVKLTRSPSASDSHLTNTQKLEAWYRAVLAAPDGACLLLLDADAFITRPLDDVWERDFDVAYTVKPAKFPHNAGVVFVRSSPQSRAFVELWRNENLRMFRDGAHHQHWRRKYGGINQASLGSVLESSVAAKVQILRLPCAEWNCEDSSWDHFDPEVTRIVHVKSALRRAVFRIGATPARLRPLMKAWHKLEGEAKAQLVRE